MEPCRTSAAGCALYRPGPGLRLRIGTARSVSEAAEKHAGHTDPPPDTSNKYALDPTVQALGKKLYFDPNFSGRVIGKDMLLRDMTTPTRQPIGASAQVSCNSCHDVTMGGSDHTETPGNVVSFGAGAYDVNSQQTINSAYGDIIYWNGRNDSLWSQIVAVQESHVSPNSSRMRVAWRLVDKYRAEYTAAFPEYPLPAELDDVALQQSRLNTDGTCKLDSSNQCPPACHTTYGPCLPRYPLDGRPGFVEFGELATCEWANPGVCALALGARGARLAAADGDRVGEGRAGHRRSRLSVG